MLAGALPAGCDTGAGDQPDCVVGGVSITHGDKIPSDECGGCISDDGGQVTCTQVGCIPTSTYELEEADCDWGVSEFYCCCKSGSPPNSPGCVSVCLVLGGVCGDDQGDVRQACEGSTPGGGGTCARDNSGTVNP